MVTSTRFLKSAYAGCIIDHDLQMNEVTVYRGGHKLAVVGSTREAYDWIHHHVVMPFPRPNAHPHLMAA